MPSAGMELLIDTIKTTSQMVKGTDYGLEIELIGSAPNSLVWALKDFRQYEDYSMADDTGSPVVLVSKTDDELDLQDDYIGQTITISEEWGWNSALPPDLLRWWVKRRPDIEMHEWLILIREDLIALSEE